MRTLSTKHRMCHDADSRKITSPHACIALVGISDLGIPECQGIAITRRSAPAVFVGSHVQSVLHSLRCCRDGAQAAELTFVD
jgi:hypothetical protein